MKASEFIFEGKSMPIIVCDVQPEYAYYGNNSHTCEQIVNYVVSATGPVLMFVNAEESGVSGDTIENIKKYWEQTAGGRGDEEYGYDEDDNYENNAESVINWNRFNVVDKGYGYLRSWMDHGISPAAIIRVIRAMYQHKISDSRQFEDLEIDLPAIVGQEWDQWMWSDPIMVEWVSVAQLKKFSGAYIVGGGRDECLREVELIMNAFNIKYKRVDGLVYG